MNFHVMNRVCFIIVLTSYKMRISTRNKSHDDCGVIVAALILGNR